MALEVDWCGERLALLAERAVYLPEQHTLLVADMHFGKDAAFRSGGIALPTGVGQADLARLSDVLSETKAHRIVFLGDLIHARSGMTPSTRETFMVWRDRHADLEVVLVRGNHDRAAGDPPEEWRIECVSEPFQEGPFALCHYPPQNDPPVPAIAGHLHPAVTLVGVANTRMVLPCFWMRPRSLVLPAFTAFSGRPQIAPSLEDRIFVIGEGSVVEAPCFT